MRASIAALGVAMFNRLIAVHSSVIATWVRRRPKPVVSTSVRPDAQIHGGSTTMRRACPLPSPLAIQRSSTLQTDLGTMTCSPVFQRVPTDADIYDRKDQLAPWANCVQPGAFGAVLSSNQLVKMVGHAQPLCRCRQPGQPLECVLESLLSR